MTDLGLVKTYCEICKFEFADAMECYIHDNDCHSQRVKLPLFNEKGLSATVDIIQEEDGTYACKKCWSYFTNTRTLQLHLMSKCMKNEQGNTYCGQCEVSLKSSEDLNHHNSQYHSNNDFTTNIAPKNQPPQFITLSRNENGNYTCPNCDAAFPSKKSIKHHLNNICSASKEHYCNLCDNTFPYMRSLRDHYDTVHVQVIKVRDPLDPTFVNEIRVERDDSGNFCCPTCNIAYKQATSFKNHMKQPCTKTKSLKMCEICSHYFDGTSGLAIHKYNYHHREINIKGIYIKDHQREIAFIRNEDDDFACPGCTFATNNSSTFKVHVRKKPCSTEIVKKASKGKKFNVLEQKTAKSNSKNTQRSSSPNKRRKV